MISRVPGHCFDDVFQANKPAVITDALTKWPGRKLWCPEYLRKRLKGRSVDLSRSADGHFGYNITADPNKAASYSVQRMAFEEASDLIVTARDDQSFYIQQQSLTERLPELLDDIQTPAWIKGTPNVNFWFGRRSITPLHHDSAHNFFAQVYGEKEFTIFPPSESKNLYPFPVGARMNHVSQVRIDKPDFERFPRFRSARPIRFVLNPGDLLFLPAFWWHHVRAMDVSISVSFWWDSGVQAHLHAPNSLRELYQRYAEDRLIGLRTTVLEAERLTFAGAAALLLEANHRWGALVLAVAAFDEFINDLRQKVGVPNKVGCPITELAGDIQRSCAILRDKGAISTSEINIGAHIASMEQELSMGNELERPNEATAWLVNAVQLLPRRFLATSSQS